MDNYAFNSSKEILKKPTDEQYIKFKNLVENELGLDWSREKNIYFMED